MKRRLRPLAIEQMERTPYDVIIADLRMPGMDGAQLLEIVTERWPQTIRIVLSAYIEQNQPIRLVPIAAGSLVPTNDADAFGVGPPDRCAS
jgi:DNA-binding NarL/FixJ family response regulator